jgi:nucleotide-binding universal stress UspA family protein
MYSKVLLAVDGSDNNKSATLEAIDIVKAMGASLTAVYVSSGTSVKPNAFGGDVSGTERKNIADTAAEEAFAFVKKSAASAGIELETLILVGNPGKEIAKITKDYDLVVCGSLGLSGISRMLMGSVSSDIVKYSYCPVLISRE